MLHVREGSSNLNPRSRSVTILHTGQALHQTADKIKKFKMRHYFAKYIYVAICIQTIDASPYHETVSISGVVTRDR